jgi:hypothetical protein
LKTDAESNFNVTGFFHTNNAEFNACTSALSLAITTSEPIFIGSTDTGYVFSVQTESV